MRKYGAVLLLAVVWSGYYTAAKLVNDRLDPFSTGIIIRLIVILLFTVVLLSRGRLKETLSAGKTWKLLLLIGCLGFLLDVTAFLGFRYSQSSAMGTVLLKTDVLMVSVMSVFIRKERFRSTDWLLIGCMLVGVFLVVGFGEGELRLEPGNLLFLLSALFVSVNAFLIQRAQNQGASNETIAYYNNGVALLCFVVAAPMSGMVDLSALRHADASLLAAVLAGGVGQLLIYLLYYKALREHPVWIVKALLLLIPVVSLLTDTLFFKHPPGILELAGTAVILICAFLLIYARKNRGAET